MNDLKQQLFPYISNESFIQVQQLCESEGLDIRCKPYAVITDKKTDEEKIYPTVYGLQIKAMRTGLYVGKKPAVFGPEVDHMCADGIDRKVPESATTTVSRLVMDLVCDFSSDPIFFKEYAKANWHFKYPHMFLGKVSFAHALKLAFADILAGQVTYEEMQCELEFGVPLKQPHTVPVNPVTAIKPVKNSVVSQVEEIFGKVKS